MWVGKAYNLLFHKWCTWVEWITTWLNSKEWCYKVLKWVTRWSKMNTWTWQILQTCKTFRTCKWFSIQRKAKLKVKWMNFNHNKILSITKCWECHNSRSKIKWVSLPRFRLSNNQINLNSQSISKCLLLWWTKVTTLEKNSKWHLR